MRRTVSRRRRGGWQARITLLEAGGRARVGHGFARAGRREGHPSVGVGDGVRVGRGWMSGGYGWGGGIGDAL